MPVYSTCLAFRSRFGGRWVSGSPKESCHQRISSTGQTVTVAEMKHATVKFVSRKEKDGFDYMRFEMVLRTGGFSTMSRFLSSAALVCSAAGPSL
jgi:hypothetical protein